MSSDGDRRIRVLHVEDDAEFAEIASTFLEREHDAIAVDTAGSAEAGLSALGSHEFDCVVSDFEMPDTDGLEFLEAVRGRHPDLPFILFTGKGSEEIASEAIAAGVTDYLQKGGGTEQYAVLANRIEHAVERHRAEREVERRRRHYDLLERASTDAFWNLDLESGVVERSDRYARMFGYEADETRRDSSWWRERVHPADRDRVEAALDGAIEAGEDVYEADYRFRNADGSYSDVYARGYVVYDGGEPVRVVGAMTDVSGLKERERELEDVRTRLELVLEGTDTGVWEWDPATGEVVWDETVERIFGLTEGAFEGTYRAFEERIVDEDVDRVEEAIARTLETDERYEVEFRVHREDDAVRWVRAEGLLRDGGVEDGVRMIGLISDVTERKEREERLERIERRFDAVFDDPAVFMGLLEPGGTVILGNRAGREFLGEPYGEGTGRHFLETRWWEDAAAEKRAEIERGIERAGDGEFFRFQAEHENPDGERVFLDGHIRPVRDDDGEVVSLLVEGIDVSDRIERERMIEGLHEVTRELLEAEDPESVAGMVCESVTDVLGFPSNVVRLRVGDELRPVAVSDEARDVVGERPVYSPGEGYPGRVLATGEPLLIDDREDDGEDGEGWAFRSAFYLPMGDHGTVSIVDDEPGAFGPSDVALARILVNNAASVLDRLEGERAIRDRERELARQNDRLERFASVISHDLKGPLNVAKGRLELLEAEEAEKAVIDNALDRMGGLLDDVYELTRRGQVVGDREPVDLGSVAEAAWQTVVIDGASLEVAGAGLVDADETRLQELLENLFRNAVEHGGGGTVRVGTFERGFFVEDEGPGIPEGKRERVFEPGYTTHGGGTGFGLAIVESIGRAHGWEVSVGDGADGARFEIVTESSG